jgi:hypothetical protein
VLYERTQGAKSYLDLLKPGNPRRVMLGMSIQMWSQLSGMNVMMYVFRFFAFHNSSILFIGII